MVMSPVVPETQNDYAGEDQQQLSLIQARKVGDYFFSEDVVKFYLD
jgi:hypothetical protein